MKKTITAMIAIACLMVISLSTFALSRMRATESMKIQSEKITVDTNTQSADSATLQTFSSDSQQASGSYVTENSGQTLDKNESTLLTSESYQSQYPDLPVPLPDGRIFLHASAGTEDPIPYIPTENPKISNTTPIEPPELDS